MFEKYRLALANPRRSPRASLEKGGTGLLVKEQGNDLVLSGFRLKSRGKEGQKRSNITRKLLYMAILNDSWDLLLFGALRSAIATHRLGGNLQVDASRQHTLQYSSKSNRTAIDPLFGLDILRRSSSPLRWVALMSSEPIEWVWLRRGFEVSRSDLDRSWALSCLPVN